MSSSPLLNRSATRKRPHCKDCGQPLKGHPKGVCLINQQFDHEGTPVTVASRASASASPGPSLGRASPADALVPYSGPTSSSSTATPRPSQRPDLRPVMPCTFDRNDRPSEVSASPSVRGPIHVSLADRIGPKVEVNEDGFPVRPLDDQNLRARQRRITNGSRHSDPIAPPRRSFYDYDEPRPIALRHSGSSIFPDHSASQQRPNMRTPTPIPWSNDMNRDEGSSQDSMSETGSFYNGYNPGEHYNLDDDDDRYLYDDHHLHHLSQRAAVGRIESSPESAGFPDDTPSEASVSEAGTFSSAAQTDHTGLSINTLLQAGSAQPVLSVYSVKRELGPYLKKSARKLGLFAEVSRPPPDARNGANADNIYLAMGRDRKRVHGYVTEHRANPREAHHRGDGHRRTSTHACEHCHSTTPTPHHGMMYPPHTPVGPHHQSLPPGAPGSSPHLYPPPYNTAMAPPLQQPPGASSGGAMGIVGTVCTIIVGLASLGLTMVWVLART